MKTLAPQVLRTLMCLFVLTLINCQKQDLTIDTNQLEPENPLYQQRMVSLSEIPGIKNYINTKISEGVFNKTGELNQAVFDTDNILEVIDTLNNANYSFRFTLPNSSIGKFFNLVVGQTPTGELITPFVLKYECDASHIDQYIANDFDFSFFKGTIALHKYTDFFGEGYFSKVDETVVCPPEYDDVGDPIPCDTTPINGGGSGGGGSTGDGSGDTGSTGSTGGSVGGTGGSNISITYEDCECHTVHASGGCTHPILTITIGINRSLNKASNKGEDCPDCTPDNDGGIAINTLTFADMSTTLKHNLTLSSNAISFIGNSDNIKEVTGAYFYLQVHQDDFNGGYMAEAKSFAKLAIEALASNDYSGLFALNVFNQNPYSVWKILSQAEKDLIKEYPFEAYGIFKNREIAENETRARFGSNGRNDKSDAFRHAYYNVINAKVVGVDMAKLFSDAHESENPIILILEEQMDLFNNNIGHQSISGNGSLSLSQLADLIYQKLLNGDLIYLSPLDPVIAPYYGINNLTQLIPTNQ